MHYRRTPELSVEGTREVLDEIENGSPNTPERRATFQRARAMRPLVERALARIRRQAVVDE